MTEQQTAATDNALLEKLVKVEGNTPDSLGICTMWHRNPDGPEAAERIKSLLAEVEAAVERERQQTGLINKYGLRITELLADRQRMREALENVPLPSSMGTAAEHFQRFYNWHNQVVLPALNPASKEVNDG